MDFAYATSFILSIFYSFLYFFILLLLFYTFLYFLSIGLCGNLIQKKFTENINSCKPVYILK
ncbi:hypothetical protein BUTYVIB_00601 [Eshraghiella crossota DSM 2876]|uniref:Uncharacterized protein n=1 Tax=Eshraghiella crossota DSM 2876 TaxID=511680 RepID=D4RXQ1_9FIRM|nr:hypothetical protein BUTYVIB_00601 [Butyrivibrio crossotus DSM 2876]